MIRAMHSEGMDSPGKGDPAEEVTLLLHRLGAGEAGAAEALARLVHAHVRGIAERAMRNERDGHTLQPTLLADEALVRLIGQRQANWQNRRQFYAVAAQVIRRILVDHARARRRVKRDHGLRVTLTDLAGEVPGQDLDMLALDQALSRLESAAPRQADVVKLRYFGGLEIDAIAHMLDIAPATVKRDWVFARAFLLRQLQVS